jgi:acetyl-CoA C-acetyltransferase
MRNKAPSWVLILGLADRFPQARFKIILKALEDKNFVREKAGVEHMFGSFPRDRMSPNGGSVALGHPFAATGARILSQALKELAALPKGSRAIVSICADGGLGTVALLEHCGDTDL